MIAPRRAGPKWFVATALFGDTEWIRCSLLSELYCASATGSISNPSLFSMYDA